MMASWIVNTYLTVQNQKRLQTSESKQHCENGGKGQITSIWQREEKKEQVSSLPSVTA